MRITIQQHALALVLLAAASSAQAANGNANASATVVTPIAITAPAHLVFGSFAAGPGGTVTVSTSGARSASGPVLMGAAPASAARFNITGEPGATYSISHSGSAVLTNSTGSGGETMVLAKFSDLTGANGTSGNVTSGTLDGAGNQSLFVGATLSVAAGQAPGVYTGTVLASVDYN